MKHNRTQWLHGIVLLAAIGLAMAAPVPPTGFEDRSDALAALLATKAREGEPGFAITVLRGDEVLLAEARGLADLGSRRPIGLDTRFYAASVGKTFTAAAVLKLWEEDRLELESTLSDHFSGLPAFAREVTVYHLLTHTSGLPDYHDEMPSPPSTNQDVVRWVRGLEGLRFRPGVDYAYSNTGYVLLAEIVRMASGKSYAQFVQERFLVPLALSRTVVRDETQPPIPDRAVGYSREGETFVEDDDHGAVTGPGGIYSTVGDLARWLRALLGHEALSARSTKLLFHMPVTLSGKQSWMAMGWFDETFGSHDPDLEGIPALGAIGMLGGFRAMIKVFPEHDLAFVVLSNSSQLPVGGAEIARTYLLPGGP